MARFVIKHRQEHVPVKRNTSNINIMKDIPMEKEDNIQEMANVKEVVSHTDTKENKTKEKKLVMNTAEKVEMAKKILAQQESMPKQKVKKIRKDKGLIERTESSKTILTEDNKELLVD